ncbi:dihydrodipicolinate synthase family protein [Telmatospirillum sp.]|uniref:dihydrodipicolinate synthase family protein n=1 Tax=Telmatospirillum sp. TaxID=2079197 RepID=UPI002844EDE8|nr:dihydrodipicolinate synthase family protein [Telmatospirillum sp.]MDR3439829.1 dihydrodipicolinate synthase family protein [Telmatospirillum sp.]
MTSQTLDETAKGVFVISATPFTDDGSLDLESTDRLIDFYLERSVHGITVLGMMGEAPKLTHEESILFLGRVLARVKNRVPVVAGVSNPGIGNLAKLAHQAMDLGAAGVMVAPAAGLKTEDQIFAYFSQVFTLLGPKIPVCFQDYPQNTTVFSSVATLNRLVDNFPQLVMLKHEDFPGLRKVTQLRQQAERDGRRRISILVGNGGLYFPQELRRGVDGAMTGFAFPEMLVETFNRATAGDFDGAENVFDTYLPLVRHEYQPGIGLAIRKEILRRRGAIACAATRAPGARLDRDDHAELDILLHRLDARLRA